MTTAQQTAEANQRGPVAPGVGVALLTLFDENGSVLTVETAAFALRLVDAGARSVLVAGSVGEFYTLDDDERLALIAAVKSALPSHVPVVAHVGGVPVDRASALAGAAQSCGADALIALPKNGVNISDYYARIRQAGSGLPLLAYHLPQSGAIVDLDELPKLGVDGIKDSSGDSGRLSVERAQNIEVYTGSPTLLGFGHAIGIAGAFIGVANAHLELCVAAFEGEIDAQSELAKLTVQLRGDFPGAIKRMASEKWGIPPFGRTPPGRTVGDAVAE